MTTSLRLVNPLEDRSWNEALSRSPDASFFHTSNWARVLCESYRYRPAYFVEGRETLATLVPFLEVRSVLTGRRGVSLPFTDYSAPIIGDGSDRRDVMRQVVDHARAAGWRYVEIRGLEGLGGEVPVFSEYHGHVVALAGTEEAQLLALRDSTKRNIKKAAKEGVTVARLDTEGAVAEFYRLNCLTRKEHGLPPQPPRFFRGLFEHVISKGLGFVFLAYHHGVAVAANVYLHYRDTAIYKYGASDKAFQHLRANNLVMWEAIRWYRQNGYASLCFGRTEPENQGLLQFKSGWGAAERQIRYYRYDVKANAFVRGKAHGPALYNRVFRAMPVSLSRVSGEMLYRHMG